LTNTKNIKLNSNSSEDVFNFVKKGIDFDTLIVVKHIDMNRLGKCITRTILDDYDHTCSYGSFEEYNRKATDVVTR
jgi:hypothetical protein